MGVNHPSVILLQAHSEAPPQPLFYIVILLLTVLQHSTNVGDEAGNESWNEASAIICLVCGLYIITS